MLGITLYEEEAIAVLEPNAPLSAEDFQLASRILDPFIEDNNVLAGLIIKTEHFPGWETFSGFLSHMEFIKSHHELIQKVALVTDSPIGPFAEHITGIFVSADVKTFAFNEFTVAFDWASSDTT